MSKAEFVKQGNAMCAKGNEEIEEGFEEFAKEHGFSKNKQPSQAELEEAAETVAVPRIGKEIEGIRALGPPDEKRKRSSTLSKKHWKRAKKTPSCSWKKKAPARSRR